MDQAQVAASCNTNCIAELTPVLFSRHNKILGCSNGSFDLSLIRPASALSLRVLGNRVLLLHFVVNSYWQEMVLNVWPLEELRINPPASNWLLAPIPVITTRHQWLVGYTILKQGNGLLTFIL